MGWKNNINIQFSKQMLLSHLFLPFIIRYVKKCGQFSECYCYYIPYMFSIFIKIILECGMQFSMQFTDRFSSLND